MYDFTSQLTRECFFESSNKAERIMLQRLIFSGTEESNHLSRHDDFVNLYCYREVPILTPRGNGDC